MQYGIEFNAIDNASAAIAKMERGFAELDKRVESSSDAMGGAARATQAYVARTDAATPSLRSMVREVLSMNRLMTQATGLFGAAFGIGQIASFSSELISAESAVANLFGSTGGELTALTEQVGHLATVFKVDYSDVLQQAQVLTNEFGVDARSALNTIQTAFEKGLNPDFISEIDSLAPRLAAAGKSADETIAIIGQAQRAGRLDQLTSQLDTLFEKAVPNAKRLDSTLAAIGIDGNASIADLANRTTTAAQAQQQLLAGWADFKIFIAQSVVPTLADAVGWVQENATQIKYWGEMALWAAGGIGAVYKGYSMFKQARDLTRDLSLAWSMYKDGLGAARVAQIAFNIVANANPIGLLVTGVAAAGVAVYGLITYWDDLKGYLYDAGALLMNTNPLTWAYRAIDWLLPEFGDAIDDTMGSVLSAFEGLGDWLSTNFLEILHGTFDAMTRGLLGTVEAAVSEMEARTEQAKEKSWQQLTAFYAQIKGLSAADQTQAVRTQAAALGINVQGLTDAQIATALESFGALSTGKLPSFSAQPTSASIMPKGKRKNPSGDLGLKAGLAGVQGDATKATNLTINIGKFQEQLVVQTTTLTESPNRIREIITQELLRAVNDVNSVL